MIITSQKPNKPDYQIDDGQQHNKTGVGEFILYLFTADFHDLFDSI